VTRLRPVADPDGPYEPVYDERDNLVGWRAKDRAWWDAPRARAARGPVDEETRSLEAILDSLDAWSPSLPLRARLAVCYELDPVRVSRLVDAVLNEAGVRDPCAVVYFRLSALEHGET
jgi:hypothetical protein